jgi:pyruvate/2-oxoglutarate dehydrogenase complex dihydrolipoamide acyltransferase (E2) component
LQTAREQNVDVIGLSGLITPSLDEMSHVAQEMEREGFTLTYLPFLATAVAAALAKFPNLNASIEGNELVLHQRINLGIDTAGDDTRQDEVDAIAYQRKNNE